MHHFVFLDDLYNEKITEIDYIELMTGTRYEIEITKENEFLGRWLMYIIAGIHCTAIISGKTLEEVIAIMDEKDIWLDLATCGPDAVSGWNWDLGRSIYYIIDPDDDEIPESFMEFFEENKEFFEAKKRR